MRNQDLAQTLATHLANIIQRVDNRIRPEDIIEETIVPAEALNRFGNYIRSQNIRREPLTFPADCTFGNAVNIVCSH